VVAQELKQNESKEPKKATVLTANARVEFWKAPTNDRVDCLHDQKLDVVFSTFSITKERAEQGILFSIPYYGAHQTFLTRKGRALTLEDSVGLRVCTTQGSTSAKNLRQIWKNRYHHDPDPGELQEREEFSDCIALLKGGEIDAVTGDDVILLGYLMEDPDHLQLSDLQPPMSVELYGAGMSADNPALHEAVNTAIGQIVASGRWRRMCQRWVGFLTEKQHCPQHPPEPPSWLSSR
jgi:glutamate transport system substrate-binding protein